MGEIGEVPEDLLRESGGFDIKKDNSIENQVKSLGLEISVGGGVNVSREQIEKIKDDVVEIKGKLENYKIFMGDYLNNEGAILPVNLTGDNLGDGQVRGGVLEVGGRLDDAVRNHVDYKNFISRTGLSGEEVEKKIIVGTIFHEEMHTLIDSKPHSKFDEDLFDGEEGLKDMRGDKKGDALTLVDEMVVYGVQYLEGDKVDRMMLEADKTKDEEEVFVRKKLGMMLGKHMEKNGYGIGGKNFDENLIDYIKRVTRHLNGIGAIDRYSEIMSKKSEDRKLAKNTSN